MNRDKKLQILREWEERMKACDDALADLILLTGAAPESKMVTSTHGVMGLATSYAAALVECSPDWLESWWLDRSFGETPMKAGLAGEPLRDIRTIEELAALIFDDEEHAGTERTKP